jgi:hypothetical protein
MIIFNLKYKDMIILAYTVAAMQANFVLCLFPPSSSSNRTCLQSCGRWLRRFFRRFCFCLVLCVWSLSFTSTIPLLYTIDSNEKSPKPVYCPGTTEISYLEEWFDRNRFSQTIIFNLIPLLISLFLSMIALLKILYDCLTYLCLRCQMSKCSPCRKKFPSYQQQQQQSIPNSMSLLSSLGMTANNNIQTGIDLVSVIESPTNERSSTSSSNLAVPSCGRCLSASFLRVLLILSCCLLACIYPIAMRFYLIYFSVLVPLIFAVLNYSLGQLTSTQQQEQQQPPPPTTIENRHLPVTIPAARFSTATYSSINVNNSKLPQTTPPLPINHERDNSSTEQFELQSSLITNLLDERDESQTPSSSSPPSTTASVHHHHRSTRRSKRKYFSNHLYENTRNLFARSNN